MIIGFGISRTKLRTSYASLIPFWRLFDTIPGMIYELTRYLMSPYVLCYLMLGYALVRAWRRLRRDRPRYLRFVFVSYFLSLLIAIPAVSYWPVRWTEGIYPPLAGGLHEAQAIVVLGGGLAPADSIRGHSELSSSSTRRCLYAFELFRQAGPLPVYVTGAKPDPGKAGPGEAEAMRDFLLALGIPRGLLHLEDRSRTTHDNAVFTSELLRDAGVHKIVLVTEALHMGRSVGCFHREGI